MVKPTTSHLVAAKRILRYVKGTSNYGIQYSKNPSGELVGYSDSDWSGDKDDRKNNAAYVFMIGNAAFSWSSKKESVVALSSCEAEYIATSMTACQAKWINMLLMELQLVKDEKMELRIDSKSTIGLAKHPVAHGRSKHIETRFHFLRDQWNNGKFEVKHCKTDEQIADMLTKPLKLSSFDYLKKKLGMAEASN
ncbi:secreted RxLR effector protein 161-like [Medicago truncatula]|uniref:secreted RxLR effector protein 161-like n=1 Tax=Medicago truncatula TaxID=3880 RepID=UPI0019676C26|nr:secreted RxLR effector protein 161-like [Medicago truncatula]